MAKLTISSGGRVLKTLDLKKSITLGREVGDVVIKNPAISARHLKIEKVEADYILTDLNSTNGTYVNDVKISGKHNLQSGDTIVVGKFSMKFHIPEQEKIQAQTFSQLSDLGGRTMVIDSSSIRSIMNKIKPSEDKGNQPSFEPQPASKPYQPFLVFITGAGTPKMIKLEKETTVIGSSDRADIRLKAEGVADIAVLIRVDTKARKSSISFVGGDMKLTLNDQEIVSKADLKDRDKFSISNYRFEFRG